MRSEQAALARRLRTPKSEALVRATLQLLQDLDKVPRPLARAAAPTGSPSSSDTLAHSINQVEAALSEICALRPSADAFTGNGGADDMSDAV
mgnify:CR=1 FL=1